MVHIISAIGCNGEYSFEGKLPWPRNAEFAKADMKFFREYTMGKTIIMGYNTWVSIGKKPLPGRKNIVIGKSDGTDAIFLPLLDALIEYPNAIVIGGLKLIKEICKEHIHHVQEIVINVFEHSFEADKFLVLDDIPMIYKKIKTDHYTQRLFFWPINAS